MNGIDILIICIIGAALTWAAIMGMDKSGRINK